MPAPRTTGSAQLDTLLKQAGSLDADERFEAIDQLKRYAGHRKVSQAAWELRNDPDRRVRTIAREILEEADRRTSGALAVQGQVEDEREQRIDELLADLSHAQPFERVTALKALQFFLPHPKIDAALERLRKDPDRTVRLLIAQMLDERKERERDGEKPQVNEIVGGVLVSSPYTKKRKKAWKEATADRLAPEMIPWIGFLYLLLGLPGAVTALWLWASVQGYIDPGLSPDATLHHTIEAILGMTLDPLSLALSFAGFSLMVVGGVGLMVRQEWGRRAILLYHAILGLFGFLIPGLAFKFIPVLISGFVIFFLTRREIVTAFKGHDAGAAPAPPAKYGDIDRKTW